MTTVIPSADLTDSSWNNYVYRSYNEVNGDQDVCTAMCAFDHPKVSGQNCHFTVLESNTCHLGTLDVETSVLANHVAGVDLSLKTGNFEMQSKWSLHWSQLVKSTSSLRVKMKVDPYQNANQIPTNSGFDLDTRVPLKPSFGPRRSRTCNTFFQKTVGLL